LRTVLDQLSTEQDAQEWDAAREAGKDIFPAPPEGSSSSSGAMAFTEDPIFLTVRVSGVPLIFRDVPKDAWFAPSVREVMDRGIVSGYREADGTPRGLFGPADSLTIEQLAKIAVGFAGVNLDSCGSKVRNAGATGRWSEAYIRCAEHRGWAVYADGSVNILHPARRAEVVATLLQASAVKVEPRTGSVFRDVDSSVEFAALVETAARAGIVSGDHDEQGSPTGTFRPRDPINRAEVAKIVTRVLQVYGKE
jgi:hypothetical protein